MLLEIEGNVLDYPTQIVEQILHTNSRLYTEEKLRSEMYRNNP